MLEKLRQDVYLANLKLSELNLVVFTWGNVSGLDRETGLFVIKPSGVEYSLLSPEDLVVCDLDGNVVEGDLNPSSDMPTHLYLYKNWGEKIGGVAHTHSKYAAAWSQACRSIPCYGTTHADQFYGSIPCTRALTKGEVSQDYELNTGKVIVESFLSKDPVALPGCLVSHHGPFAWGNGPQDAVYCAKVIEEVAEMAIFTEQLSPDITQVPSYLLDKHYLRKHGPDAYYGQKDVGLSD